MENSRQNEKKIEIRQLDLPKGGGAIEGIGEKFQSDAFTGTASLSLPVAVSPCRGITPDLSINYSSGSGNGLFGIGWGLSVPSITRKTNKGIPRYTDKDIFILSGSDDLVPQKTEERKFAESDDSYLVTTYRPRNEGSFSLIEKWQNLANTRDVFWKVTTADHVNSIFGKTEEARIVNPEDPSQIFSWLLEETYNPEGDHQVFVYEADVPLGETVVPSQRTTSTNRYLRHIFYGQVEPYLAEDEEGKQVHAGSMILNDFEKRTNPAHWHFEVLIDYSGKDIDQPSETIYEELDKAFPTVRQDAFSNYLSGFEIRTNRLCHSILMFHRFKEEQIGTDKPVLVTASHIQYNTTTSVFAQPSKFTQHGFYYTGDNNQPYDHQHTPSIALTYGAFRPEDHVFRELNQDDHDFPLNLNGGYSQWVDLFGQGLAGVLHTNDQGGWYAAPNAMLETPELTATSDQITPLPKTHYGLKEWKPLANFPAVNQIGSEAQTAITDVNASGMLDVVVEAPAMNGFWEMNFKDQWDDFKAFGQFPADLAMPQLEFVDMSGDGLTDRVQVGAGLIRITPSLGTKGYGQTYEQHKLPEDFPNALGSSDTEVVQFANLSGGGLQDIVQIENGKICYWPNLGYGRFDEPVIMENAPNFGPAFNTQQLYLADLDGSGTQDLIYISTDHIKVWINQSGNRFLEPILTELPCPFASIDQVQFADVTGQGTQSMVITYSLAGPELASKHVYYDFCKKQKPYLLEEIDNNMGANTKITYASSVDFYLRDQQEGLPWITHLPFPVQVVERVTIHDQISKTKYSTLSSYHHGYYDGVEREFRGFGRVDSQAEECFPETNPDNPSYSAPSKTITWFYPGVEGEEWDALKTQYEKEFFSQDKEAWQLPDTVFDWNGKVVDEKTLQQAYTALAGMPLRSELYGLDGGEKQTIPYTVNQSNYQVRLLQEPEGKQYGVFLTIGREHLEYSYERIFYEGEHGGKVFDPQIHHSLTLKVDEFGNPELSTAIAYPRRPNDELEIFDAQKVLHLSSSTSDFINNQEPENYLIGVAWEERAFEIKTDGLSGEALLTFDQVLSQIENTDNHVLLGHHKAIFAKADGKTPYPEEVVGLPLLIYQEKTLEFDQRQLDTAFEEKIPDLADKMKKGGYEASGEQWWNPGLHQEYYGPEQYYMPSQIVDQEGNTTSYRYDDDLLYTKEVTNALKQSVYAQDFSYQHLQPLRMVDINNNKSEVKLDALGMVIATSFYGTEGGKDKEIGFARLDKLDFSRPESLDSLLESAPDYLLQAQSYFYYDLSAWEKRRGPVFNVSINPINYPNEDELQPDNELQISLSRSDGFGRLLEAKARVEKDQASKPERDLLTADEPYYWLTSGRVEYNNKGLPVRQWEPYYSDTPDYIPNDEAVKVGVSPVLYYDPLDRNYKTITAKGFLEESDWTAWEESSFDANDLLESSPYWQENVEGAEQYPEYKDDSLTQKEIDRLKSIAALCKDTPDTAITDNLGNVIVSRQILKSPKASEPMVLDTLMTYDIQGRQLTSIDPRLAKDQKDNPAIKPNFRMSYGYTDQPIKTISADAGTTRAMSNIYGNLLFEFDARETLTTYEYDALQRNTEVHVTNQYWEEDPTDVLDILTLYGSDWLDEDSDRTMEMAQDHNLLGQMYKEYSHAKVTTVESYSLTGGALSSRVQLVEEYKKRVDWKNPDNGLMPARTSSATYDALGRVIEETDVIGNTTKPGYWLSGMLRSLQVTHTDENGSTSYIQNITYDAKGQQQVLRRNNDLNTSYQYDKWTFAVKKILTEQKADPDKPTTEYLQQDLYTYDPVGNVIEKQDATQDTVWFKGQQVDPINKYTFDSLYRLVEATGRQQPNRHPTPNGSEHWTAMNTQHQKKDDTALIAYTERYRYDWAGNLFEINHDAQQNDYTTKLVVSDTNNRAVNARLFILEDLSTEALQETYGNEVNKYFDAAGNQTHTETAKKLKWNCSNNIGSVILGIEPDADKEEEEGKNRVWYLYDSGGMRTRKVFEDFTSNTITETLYFGSVEIHRKYTAAIKEGEEDEERHTQRISDGTGPLAVRNTWEKAPENKKRGGKTITWYQLNDMQESVNILLDKNGGLLSREEYSPYGQTTFEKEYTSTNSLALKTHRYCNKELDRQTGFYYYGLRYYQAHLGRWLSSDPAGTIDGLNLYVFVGGNPVTFVDVGGMSKRQLKLRQKAEEKEKLASKRPEAAADGSLQFSRELRGTKEEKEKRAIRLHDDLDRMEKKIEIKDKREQIGTIDYRNSSQNFAGFKNKPGTYGHGRYQYLLEVEQLRKSGGQALEKEIDHSPNNGLFSKKNRDGSIKTIDTKVYDNRIAVSLPKMWHRKHISTRAGEFNALYDKRTKKGFSKKKIADFKKKQEGFIENGDFHLALSYHLVHTFHENTIPNDINEGQFTEVINSVQEALNYAAAGTQDQKLYKHDTRKSAMIDPAQKATIVTNVNKAIQDYATKHQSGWQNPMPNLN